MSSDSPDRSSGGKSMSIIVTKGTLDWAYPPFILATTAAAMGLDVTMFFTFWGLNAIRKYDKPSTPGKNFLQKMFGVMMPRGARKLKMSKLNFAGMGPVLMKKMMRANNVMSLDEMIATAKEQDIKMIACTMSMDVMGLKAEELIDGLEYAGVATYLGEADEANVNLFI